MREEFEHWHREYFPDTNVTRKGPHYTKQIVNNRWFVWQAARGVAHERPNPTPSK